MLFFCFFFFFFFFWWETMEGDAGLFSFTCFFCNYFLSSVFPDFLCVLYAYFSFIFSLFYTFCSLALLIRLYTLFFFSFFICIIRIFCFIFCLFYLQFFTFLFYTVNLFVLLALFDTKFHYFCNFLIYRDAV